MLSGNTVLLRTTILVLLVFSRHAMAEDARGEILKTNGEVYVVDQRGDKRKVGDSKFVVHELDTIVTHDGGRAVVRFNDGALSVLDEKSSLRVEKSNWLSYIGGKVYFTFRKVFNEPRRVKTPFSTIGVRGTTFIVYADDSGQGVALQEGKIEVESPGEEYELHIKRELDEFAAFKQQAAEKNAAMQREFGSYKKNIQQEFVEYKKRFTLEANQVIRFTGNRVDQTRLDDASNAALSAEFTNFEAEAGELLDAFRAQAKQHREQQEKKQQQPKSIFDDFF